MVRTYIPGFSQMLLNSGLDFRPELTGGGPAYVDILPGAMPEPADFTPFAPSPVDEFQQRIAQAEEQARALAQPSVTPPAMSAPDPGALNMLMRPDLFDGGPAYVDMLPGALPEPMEQPEAQAPAQYVAPAQYEPFSGRPLLERIADMDGVGGPAYMNIMPDAMPEPMEQPEAQTPFVPSIQPSAPPIMQAPSTGLSVGNLGGNVLGFTPSLENSAASSPGAGDRLTRQQILDMYPNDLGLSALRDGGFSGIYTAPPLQRDPVTGLYTYADGQQGFQFVTEKGRSAGYGKGSTGFLTASPETQFRLWDERGKNRIVSQGTGMGGLQSIYNLANQFNKEQGKKANWGIERFNPATGRWERVAGNDPSKNIFGKIASVALPIGAAILTAGASIPVQMAAGAAASGLGAAAAGRNPLKGAIIGGLTAGAGAAGGKLGAAGKLGSIGAKTGTVIGSGLGATAGGLATGQSLEQALKGGALSAAGTFAGQQLGGGLRNLGVEIPGFNVSKTFDPTNIIVTPTGGAAIPVSTGLGSGGGRPEAPPQIDADGNMVLTGNRLTFGGVPIGLAGANTMAQPGLAAANDSIAESIRQAQQRAPENEIVVTDTARPAPTSNIGAGALPLFGAGLPAVVPSVVPETIGDPIEVVERRPVKDDFDAAFPVVPDVGTIAVPENEIVVRPQQPAQPTFDPSPVAQILPDLTKTPVDVVGPEKSILDKLKENLGVTDYMRLAALGLGLVGGGGGGNRGALSTIPRGMFGGSGVFGGRLPAATLPGASTGFAPRTAAELRPKTTQDWYRYGYGPEQSFFSYVPKGEPNTSRAYTGYEQAQADEDKGFAVGGMAGGGASNSYAVNGPGTGRSDEIPALLSDGEYVIDAETVALLGDGSSKAGAERLDQLRVKIRKDKGRKLAKGEFSVNAKRPEHYLKGGRA